jgi:hypothetical protein
MLRKITAAGFCMMALSALRLANSEPIVLVEKTIEAQQTKFVLSGAGLPEIRSITFSCTYTVPKALIMDAIVSSPQPATAVSVLVDTIASSMSISIHAVSTLLLPDKAPIVIFKINTPTTAASWFLSFVKAIIIDKQGAVVELPILNHTSGVQKLAYPSVSLNTPIHADRAILFSLNGRKASGSGKRNAAGYYLKSMGLAYTTVIVSVR